VNDRDRDAILKHTHDTVIRIDERLQAVGAKAEIALAKTDSNLTAINSMRVKIAASDNRPSPWLIYLAILLGFLITSGLAAAALLK